MRSLVRLTLTLILLGCALTGARAQTPQANNTGTITGRIMVGDKPAQGVAVMLMPANNYSSDRKAVAQTTTDADGQFRLANIAAGRYEVLTVAPAFVAPASTVNNRSISKSVNLTEGETVEKIDFTLVRGGVITGRVTDAEGRPVIGENVRLTIAEQNSNRRDPFFFNPFMYQTDDRGIYRIYGIPPGRYVVSVGEDTKSGIVRMSFGRTGFYTRTFHPGVTDQSRANVIEVTEGSETTNADIALGRRAETYAVSGLVVDAETGKPIPNVATGYGSLREGENQMGAMGFGARTDAEGRFRIDGVLPGRYAAFTAPGEQNDTYSVPVTFEVNESDVTGLVIKVRRGASISGVAVIEGTADRAVLSKLSQLLVAYWPESDALVAPMFSQGERINADGQFRINGLRAGKVRLMLGGWPPPKGFTLLRVERDGVEQRAGIVEVPSGGQVTGIRFVLEYGSGIVRGQVRVENGTLPEGTRLYVSARRPNTPEPNVPGAEVDARGRFTLDGIPPGEYQLRLAGRLGPNGPPVPPVLQSVNVTNGAETEVTLVLDLNAKGATDKQ